MMSCSVRAIGRCVSYPRTWVEIATPDTQSIMLEDLAQQLRLGLDRDNLALGEIYYSLSHVGTSLQMHLDEHHPATKQTTPADASHRRSVSFLLYLSDESMLVGGELRAYPRINVATLDSCGVHADNLQIGWFNEVENGGNNVPVFLDAWVRPTWMDDYTPAEQWATLLAAEKYPDLTEDRFYELCQPRYQLYIVCADGSRTHILNQPIAHNDPDFAGTSLEPEAFVERLRARMEEPYRSGYTSLMQDCARQQVVDIKAVGGTLVLFDSVSVKHMVLPVTAGKRLALGGWFHEPSQEYASWYDSAFTAAF